MHGDSLDTFQEKTAPLLMPFLAPAVRDFRRERLNLLMDAHKLDGLLLQSTE